MPKPLPSPYVGSDNARHDEEDAVHTVYEQIAPHFAQTRHKPWPLITSFLATIPPYSLGLDAGAGNGQYLTALRDAVPSADMVLLDRSQGLLSIAKDKTGADCVRAGVEDSVYRSGIFADTRQDFAISIAVIHHLTTPERRLTAVQTILPALFLTAVPPYSRFFLYVWSYEQGPNSRRMMGSAMTVEQAGPNRAAGERVQDVLVPWVMQSKQLGNGGRRAAGGKATDADAKAAAQPGPSTDAAPAPASGPASLPEPDKVYHRYYHLFVEGELRGLVEQAAANEGFELVSDPAECKQDKWLRIKSEGWELDNWWLEGEVGRQQLATSA